MASGTLHVNGDDVLDALTECSARTKYERVLNSYGETLANLIAEQVFTTLLARLSQKPSEE